MIFARRVQKNLRTFPLADRERIEVALGEIAEDPVRTDIKKLRNYPNEFRKRIGDYRIFFAIDHARQLIEVHDVVRRTTTTYRRRR